MAFCGPEKKCRRLLAGKKAASGKKKKRQVYIDDQSSEDNDETKMTSRTQRDQPEGAEQARENQVTSTATANGKSFCQNRGGKT